MELPDLVTHDRDYRMLEARKQGANYREIGKLFGVSASTAHAGVNRALKREATRYVGDMQNVGWLFMERYDAMLRDIIPFTKAQKIQDPDTGREVPVPPSWEAVDRAVKVMGEMKKMLGLDQEHIQLDVVGAGGPSVEDGKSTGETSPEAFAKEALAELIRVGAIAGPEAEALRGLLGREIIDAELVEDEAEMGEIEAAPEYRLPSVVEPKVLEDLPEWLDEDEEEREPGDWVPRELGNASEFDTD